VFGAVQLAASGDGAGSGGSRAEASPPSNRSLKKAQVRTDFDNRVCLVYTSQTAAQVLVMTAPSVYRCKQSQTLRGPVEQGD